MIDMIKRTPNRMNPKRKFFFFDCISEIILFGKISISFNVLTLVFLCPTPTLPFSHFLCHNYYDNTIVGYYDLPSVENNLHSEFNIIH